MSERLHCSGTWREEVERLPSFAPGAFRLQADGTALIVVDMQYVDAHRDYGLGALLREEYPAIWDYYFDRVDSLVVPNIALLLDEFRGRHMRVIFLTLGPVLPDGADLLPGRRGETTPALKSMFHAKGKFEAEILSRLAPAPDELVVNKTSRSAFNSTAIERTLRNLGISTLVVVGVTTSSCVDTTARDAADRGFKTVIVEDACAELDEPSHIATLRQFVVRWGRVWSTEETISTLSSDAATSGSPGRTSRLVST